MSDPIDGRDPLIIVFVADLMSSTRIEGAASKMGYQVKIFGRAEELSVPASADFRERPGEPIEGPLAPLVDQLTSWQPALLIFDMANPSIPWRNWLPSLKSSPATRRIPIICYGPHVDKNALADAATMISEIDIVVPRSRFFSSMPDLITATARTYDHAAMFEDCRQALSPDALSGLRAFDEARYFDAHEHLEDAWNADVGPARELYRAVLQVAVAYLQIERRNFRGAMKMFLRARQWLVQLPDTCRGIDVARLRSDAESVRQALVALGPEGIDQFDLQSLPPVRYGPGGIVAPSETKGTS